LSFGMTVLEQDQFCRSYTLVCILQFRQAFYPGRRYVTSRPEREIRLARISSENGAQP